jgi:hypothetical protein
MGFLFKDSKLPTSRQGIYESFALPTLFSPVIRSTFEFRLSVKKHPYACLTQKQENQPDSYCRAGVEAYIKKCRRIY